eukprot:TRINITY_DN4790_c0_g1_i8.p1 TRINITY_DN4790_c0_g1~~TRINITY_DN4790_c0_g1_i8.p1  ORF type:complete len:244 (+),score=-25.11 TRINITY_DN4790_c0_g1_i8:292-1023(+)
MFSQKARFFITLLYIITFKQLQFRKFNLELHKIQHNQNHAHFIFSYNIQQTQIQNQSSFNLQQELILFFQIVNKKLTNIIKCTKIQIIATKENKTKQNPIKFYIYPIKPHKQFHDQNNTYKLLQLFSISVTKIKISNINISQILQYVFQQHLKILMYAVITQLQMQNDMKQCKNMNGILILMQYDQQAIKFPKFPSTSQIINYSQKILTSDYFTCNNNNTKVNNLNIQMILIKLFFQKHKTIL